MTDNQIDELRQKLAEAQQHNSLLRKALRDIMPVAQNAWDIKCGRPPYQLLPDHMITCLRNAERALAAPLTDGLVGVRTQARRQALLEAAGRVHAGDGEMAGAGYFHRDIIACALRRMAEEGK
jgi:hypothetical protein